MTSKLKKKILCKGNPSVALSVSINPAILENIKTNSNTKFTASPINRFKTINFQKIKHVKFLKNPYTSKIPTKANLNNNQKLNFLFSSLLIVLYILIKVTVFLSKSKINGNFFKKIFPKVQ